jgi:hypothetical protein
LSAGKPVQQTLKDVVWVGKPYITPVAAVRTVNVFVFTILFVLLEFYLNVAQLKLWILPLDFWTILILIVIWIISLFGLLILRASHTYTLRGDAIEVRRGILRLQSFVVTPQGFGDLMVYQSIGGRIFSYGDILVNSQGERQTRLRLVQSPFKVADTIRDIMGKPIVRLENQ